MEDVAIKVEHVSKSFKLPHEKQSSIKSAFINFYKKDKGYEQHQALHDISFEVKKGEFFGIVGRNGSGKSTLLKILAGIYQPTHGHVTTNGKLVPFIELGVGFNPELTGRENVYLNGALLGFSRREMRRMYKEIVEFAELERFMDQKLKNYSSGMQVRLAFSLAIRAETDILLVDEVLAVGDADFQRKCFDYFKSLKRNKKTVVFVSHDMGAVREFCDKGILIDNSRLMLEGSSAEVATEYAKLFMQEQEDAGPADNNKSKRLGSGSVRISDAQASIKNDYLIVDVKAKAKENVEELIFGLHIIGQDGVEVTAMNNRMINQPDVKDLKKGSTVSFRWKVLNIFADGKYSIMLTLVDGSYNQLDYYEEAANFRVKRLERSNTAVVPPVEVEAKLSS